MRSEHPIHRGGGTSIRLKRSPRDWGFGPPTSPSRRYAGGTPIRGRCGGSGFSMEWRSGPGVPGLFKRSGGSGSATRRAGHGSSGRSWERGRRNCLGCLSNSGVGGPLRMSTLVDRSALGASRARIAMIKTSKRDDKTTRDGRGAVTLGFMRIPLERRRKRPPQLGPATPQRWKSSAQPTLPHRRRTQTMKRITTVARRLTTAAGGLLAHPWMTTAGLLAVNVALAIVLAVSPSTVGAEQLGPRPLCLWCFEGWHRSVWGVGHATDRFWRSEKVEYMWFTHGRAGDRVMPGTCREAHPRALCCVLPD